MWSKITRFVSGTTGSKLIMKVYDVVSRAVLNIRDNLIYVCIVLPLKTLSFCLQTQLLLLRIPLNVTHRFLRWITNLFQWPTRTQRLQSFLGCNKDDSAAVLNTMKEIRITSMNAVSKMNTFNCEFEKHRKCFDEWKKENERKTNALIVIASEEKKLMRVIVGALKHLRKLKSTRELMDQKFNDHVEGLVTLSRDVYNQSVASDDVISEESNERLKDCFNLLRREAEQMKSVIDAKMQVGDFEVAKSPRKGATAHKYHNACLLDLTMETLQSVLNLLSVENAQLKKKLSASSNKLGELVNILKMLSEEIVTLSHKFGEMVRLNNKIFDLQSELQNAKELLRTSEADRDDMRLKLLTLRSMIKEQEDYLNYDDKDYLSEVDYFREEDSYSSGFVQYDEDSDSSPIDISPPLSEKHDTV